MMRLPPVSPSLSCLLVSLALFTLACSPPTAPLPTLIPTSAPTQVGQLSPSDTAAPAAATDERPTLPPTFTPTETASVTPSLSPTATVSVTASATITDTPTITPSDEPTRPRAVTGLLEAALRATILPTDYVVPPFQGTNVPLVTATPAALGVPSALLPGLTIAGGPTPTCTSAPEGGFASLYAAAPDLAATLGCATTTAQTRQAAYQPFQNGALLWIEGEIFALYGGAQTFQFYADSFQAGIDPETSAETPPSGLLTPVRGFLKVWNGQATVRGGLGYATLPEQGYSATVQRFGGGLMVHLSGRSEVLILAGQGSGVWRSLAGQF